LAYLFSAAPGDGREAPAAGSLICEIKCRPDANAGPATIDADRWELDRAHPPSDQDKRFSATVDFGALHKVDHSIVSDLYFY
jgi:hypothetical protein